MSERIHVLAQQLLRKASLTDCSLEEIRELVQRYPYFAPAQFLLLHKLRETGDAAAAAQMQKSILYYHNPLAFQYFIDSDKFYIDADLETAVPENNKAIITPIAEEVIVPFAEEVIPAEATPSEQSLTVHNNYKATAPAEAPMVIDEKPAGVNPEVITETPQIPPPPPLVEKAPEPPLAFEPYHTVDYFASQGIRLSQESPPTDKFGKQLKSFTEWLKTMKRITPEQMATQVDAGSENKVQHLAEDSIHESDVWTEAMAEVWLKQGNKSKAVEVYNKLSLLNPSKKAYFAAKLENLKRS